MSGRVRATAWIGCATAVAVLFGGPTPTAASAVATGAPTGVVADEPVITAGCVAPTDVDVTSDFVRYDEMYTQPVDQPLIPATSVALRSRPATGELAPNELEASSPDTLLEAFAVPEAAIAVALYGPAMTRDATGFLEFLRRGGTVVKESAAVGIDAEAVRDQVGERAQTVSIGPQPAAIVVGDEVIGPGVRELGLYWSDGANDWSIVSAFGSNAIDRLVSMARSAYCR